MLQSTQFFPTAAVTWCMSEPCLNPLSYQPQPIDLSDSSRVAQSIIDKKIALLDLKPSDIANDFPSKTLRFVTYHAAFFFACLAAPAAGFFYHSYATVRDLGSFTLAAVQQNHDARDAHFHSLVNSIKYLFVHTVVVGLQVAATIATAGLINLFAPMAYIQNVEHSTMLAAQLRDEFGIVDPNGQLLALTNRDLDNRNLQGTYCTLIRHYEKKLLIETQKLQIEFKNDHLPVRFDYPLYQSEWEKITRYRQLFCPSYPKDRYEPYCQKMETYRATIQKLRSLCQTLISRQFNTESTKYTVPDSLFTKETADAAIALNDTFSVFDRIVPKIRLQRMAANLSVDYVDSLPYDHSLDILYKEFSREGVSEEYHVMRKRVLQGKNAATLLDLPTDHSKPDVLKAYRKLSVKIHPDKVAPLLTDSDLYKEADVLFKRLIVARDSLLT